MGFEQFSSRPHRPRPLTQREVREILSLHGSLFREGAVTAQQLEQRQRMVELFSGKEGIIRISARQFNLVNPIIEKAQIYPTRKNPVQLARLLGRGALTHLNPSIPINYNGVGHDPENNHFLMALLGISGSDLSQEIFSKSSNRRLFVTSLAHATGLEGNEIESLAQEILAKREQPAPKLDLSQAMEYMRQRRAVKQEGRTGETTHLTTGTPLEALLLLEATIDTMKAENQGWISQTRQMLTKKFPQLNSVNDELLEEEFRKGLVRSLKQEYVVLGETGERDLLLDKDYVQELVTVFSHDFVHAVRNCLRIGMSPEEAVKSASAIAYLYDPQLPLRLNQQMQEAHATVSISGAILQFGNPETNLEKYIRQKKGRTEFSEILKEEYLAKGIPQSVINRLLTNYSDPVPHLEVYMREVINGELAREYPYPPLPLYYPQSNYNYSQAFLSRIVGRMVNYREFLDSFPFRLKQVLDMKDQQGRFPYRGIPPSNLLQFVAETSVENLPKVLNAYISKQEHADLSLGRELDIEILKILFESGEEPVESSVIHNAIKTGRPDLVDRYKQSSNLSSYIGTQLKSLQEKRGLVVQHRPESSSKKEFRYSLNMIRGNMYVADFIQKTDASLKTRRGQTIIDTEPFTRKQQEEAALILSLLPKNSQAWKKMRNYILQHAINTVNAVAASFNLRKEFEEFRQIGLIGASKSIDRYYQGNFINHGYTINSFILKGARWEILHELRRRQGRIINPDELSLNIPQGRSEEPILDTLPHETRRSTPAQSEEAIEKLRAKLVALMGEQKTEILGGRLGLWGEQVDYKDLATRLHITQKEARRLEAEARQEIQTQLESNPHFLETTNSSTH